MKTKQSVSTKKQSVTVRDLKTRKNPKGGAPVTVSFTTAQFLNGTTGVPALHNNASCS
jgi:hypothetical protein